MRPTALLLSAFLTAAALAPGADAQQLEDRYAVMAADEPVGHLVVQTDGPRVAIDYHVDNNGRGPKNRQTVTLDETGVPIAWRIEGESAFGDPVAEQMTWSDGVLTWESQADQGELAADAPPLYIANDDSPWSLGLYARMLAEASGGEMDVVPGGRLRAERLREVSIEGLEGTAWRLTGLELAPAYVLLADDGRLLAEFSGGQTVVPEGLEDRAAALRALSRELEAERFSALQAELAHVFDGPVRIRNARVFDPRTGETGPPMAVTVLDGEITLIEPEEDAPERPGEHVVDAEGGVLVPGLHDMHAHVSMERGFLYLAAGVTGVRDMGNEPQALLDLRARMDAGELAGPRIVASGMLEGRSPYSVRTGIIADTLEEAFEAVRWYAERGYWQVKIYNSLPPEWLEPVAAEARRLGMGVTGHVPAFATPDQAIAAGYDDIAHINQLMLGWLLDEGEDTRTPVRLTGMARGADLDLGDSRARRTIAAMAENGVALDTTAVALELLMTSRAGRYPDTVRGHVDHMPVGYQRYRRRAFVTVQSDADDARYMDGFQRILDTMGLLHESGIQLLPGTDAGTGFPLHRELELYVQAGIPAGEALALATLRAEEYMGRDQWLGSIERGKRADFFLTPDDPVQDISAIRRIRLVMKDGVAYLPARMHQAMGIRPFAEPVEIRAPRTED
jgi:imidazolonepropionase-like amidohydrolase